MKSIKYIFAIASVVACAFAADAQNTYSGYFLDNYTYRYEMNPAFGNSKGFASMPGLGNMNIAMRGNLHLTDVIYKSPNGGDPILFTNPGISVDEAMSKFGNKNRIGSSNKINMLSVGFKGFKGYNTITLSTSANVEASLPKSFFSLAKEGISNKTYSIKDMFANANAYATLALNHSHDIKQVPGLRIGATLKFMVGAGYIDMRFNEADLTLGENAWSARTNADIIAAVKGLRFDMDTYTPKGPDGGAPRKYVSGANLDDGYGINGFGMGVDLGAQYNWKGFTFSAAVLDLGFMNWGKAQWASTNGTQSISTDAYTFNTDDNASNSFDNELDRLQDDLAKLYQLKDMGELNSHAKALAATINLGVDYELPVYRKLHFGLLNSTRINGPYTWTQFRLSANVAPVKVFSADVNVAAGTYGVGFGWLLNLHVTGFNLFLGMDHTIGKVSKQFIPLNSNASLNFGLNFPF